MCLARSTPHTGSSGAQGLWSEFTAKPQASRTKRGTGPPKPQFSEEEGFAAISLHFQLNSYNRLDTNHR